MDMDNKALTQRLAYLEFMHDQLQKEVSDLNTLLKKVGFPQGILSAIEVAESLILSSEEKKSL